MFIRLFLLFLCVASCLCFRCEVVSVLYNDDFAIGINTLGQSLKETNPDLPRTLLVTKQVSAHVVRELQVRGGWSVREVERLTNPHAEEEGARSHLNYVFTKLAIWGLVEFDRVIYLDGDTLVTDSIEELCYCDARLCAVTRDVYFNAGVMVLTPSAELHQDLLSLYQGTESYNQGEQGFLNLVFPEFQQCPYFDPRSANNAYQPHNHQFSLSSISTAIEKNQEITRCYRLPAFYNGDFALYVVRGDRWEVDPIFERTHPKIIHYTMGPVKPWQWLSYLMGGDAFMDWFSVYKRSMQDSELSLYYLVHLIYVSAIVAVVLYSTLMVYHRCTSYSKKLYAGMNYEDVSLYIAFLAFMSQVFTVPFSLIAVDLVSTAMLIYPLFTFVEYWVFQTVFTFSSAVVFFGIRHPEDIQSFVRLNFFVHTPLISLCLWYMVSYSSSAVSRIIWLVAVSLIIFLSNARFLIVHVRRRYFSSRDSSILVSSA